MNLHPVNQASLYIHVPFCAGLCDYCDFYSVSVAPDDKRLDQYIDRLIADTAEQMGRFTVSHVPTVYIGGGTPSVLGAVRIKRLLAGLGSLLPNTPGEFTMELNPETTDEGVLRSCRDGGVNRISLGIQSFHEPSRRLIHRRGDASLLLDRIALAADWYGGSFSADLITGLPGQDEPLVLTDIEKLLRFNPAHVSLYSLTVEADTPLGENVRSKKVRLPDPDTADRLWLTGRDALEQAGYAQYEVSNFSKPGKESRHNIRYWRMENWLGMGPAASGTLIDDERGTGRRVTWEPDVDAWLARRADTGTASVEILDRLTLMKETLLMGFRYIEGPDPGLFRKRFGRDMEEAIPRTIAAWRGRGRFEPEKTALTKAGLLLLDPFLIDAFEELDRGRIHPPDHRSVTSHTGHFVI
jgi:oxygen-independent coproporphyrinogen-3 oxidase